MRRGRSSRAPWQRGASILGLAIALACLSGCDVLGIRRVFGSNWTINFVIPLGLGGDTGLFNPPSGLTFPWTLVTGSSTGNTPPPGELVGSTSNTPT